MRIGVRQCRRRLVALLLLQVLAVARAVPIVQNKSFEYLKDAPESKFCLFYFSSSPESQAAQEDFAEAAERIHEANPHIHMYKCDGDAPENKEEFMSAGFQRHQAYLFTADQEHGIEKYDLEWNVDTIVKYVQLKLGHYPGDASAHVHDFVDEDTFYERMDETDPSTPQFVKFYEEWCGQCRQLKPTFERAALYFQDQRVHVDFVQVECSRNAETKSFCERHRVAAFPTLKLFTGEKQKVYKDTSRDILSFERFFEKHLHSSASQSAAPVANRSADLELSSVVRQNAAEIAALKQEVAKLQAMVAAAAVEAPAKCHADMNEYVRDL